jgi:hypothetical protein
MFLVDAIVGQFEITVVVAVAVAVNIHSSIFRIGWFAYSWT